jgi:hypothetical protein
MRCTLMSFQAWGVSVQDVIRVTALWTQSPRRMTSVIHLTMVKNLAAESGPHRTRGSLETPSAHNVKPVFGMPRNYPDAFSARITRLVATIRSWPKNPRHLRVPRQVCYGTFNDHHCRSFFA